MYILMLVSEVEWEMVGECDELGIERLWDGVEVMNGLLQEVNML